MRELGERLRELRQDAGLTVDAVAEHLLVSASKISRLETAQRRPSARDVRDLCQLYSVGQEERARLMTLAAQALETSWYQDADVEAVYRTYIGLEQAATQIATYQTLIIPGLLQTEGYARALIAGLRPPGFWTAERVEDVVASRIRRQEVLTGTNPVRLHAVLDEGLLRRPIGPPDLIAEQLAHLRTVADLDNVTVQIVPATIGSHPGLDGRFTVLRFADQGLRDTVYIEGLRGELFLDKDSDVAFYMDIFAYMIKMVALDEDRSRELLRGLRT